MHNVKYGPMFFFYLIIQLSQNYWFLFSWSIRYIIHYIFLCVLLLSHVRHIATPLTVACQVPLSTEFSRQEYWSGFLCPPPGDLPNPGIEPTSLMSPALGKFFTTEPPGKPFPSPGDLPDLGIEPRSPALQADFLPSEPQGKSHCYLKVN